MVGRDGEGHELLERHAVLGVDVEQGRRDRRQAQALLHDVHTDEERRGDVLLGAPLLAQGLEGAELVERMQRRTLDVLGQRVVLAENVGRGIADHARNRRGLRQALLLHQQFERPVAPAAGRDLEHAGLGALGVEDRPDVQALEQRAPGDVLGQLLDRDAGLHAPDVGLAQHQLVEGNVARGRQGDLLNGSSHGGSLRGGRPRDSLSTSNPPRKPAQPSSSRRTAPQSRRTGKTRSRNPAFPRIALITRLFRRRCLFRMYLLVQKLFEVRILARERAAPASQRDHVRRSGAHYDACAAQPPFRLRGRASAGRHFP